MKCKCSLNNSYEVIGLCDIKKFNEKINEFKDKSWTQIIIPETLIVPSNKPPVKNITKVYLNIKITSTKIIKTPSSNEPNIEGLTLTGKLLLVSGKICQRIIYLSDTVCDRICSEKFNVEFSTYIIIDKDTDIDNGAFCVYPCIEDVSVRILKERVLTKSVTLFLFAHEILLPVEKLDNAFVFNSASPDEEMARVEFDKANRRLIVTSKGISYNNPGLKEAYKLELIDGNDETTVKASYMIGGDDNANAFRDALDGSSYRVGDIVKLTFSSKWRVHLTNYPLTGRKYYMISENMQSFKINEDGIVPYILPNNIYLRNSAAKIVVLIQFDSLIKSFLVAYGSSATRTNNGGPNYFKVILYKSDAVTEKKSVSIAGNTAGRDFATALNDTGFVFGNILKLEYEEPNMVKISNYPTSATPLYTPKGTEEYFEITKTGLKGISPSTKRNSIIFNAFNSYDRMGEVSFDETTKKLVVTSTGRNYGEPSASQAYKFELLSSDKAVKASSSITGSGVLDTFETDLNDEDFEFGDLVRLEFYSNLVLWLNDYPNPNDKYYMISNKAQGLQISPKGVVPYVLPNYIALDNSSSKRVVAVYFDILYKKVLVDGSDTNRANQGGQDYFKLTLYGSDGRTEKKTKSLSGGSTGTAFATAFNDKAFEFNDVLKVSYEQADMVKITNYPDSRTAVYTPIGNEQYFRITEMGLKEFKLQSVLTFSNKSNREMLKVEFDMGNRKFIASATDEVNNSNNPNDYLSFGFSGNDYRIDINENGRDAAAGINDEDFAANGKFKIRYPSGGHTQVKITDYPTSGQDYTPPAVEAGKTERVEEFTIGQSQIEPSRITKLQNVVIFSNDKNEELMRVEFDITNMKFIAIATDKISNLANPMVDMFALLFNESAYYISYSSTAKQASSQFNGIPFNFNDTFEFAYRPDTNNQIKVTNYLNQGKNYTPPPITDGSFIKRVTFKITSTGLVLQ